LVLSGRTTWPRWTVLANPGLVYLALVTAAMAAPEPIAKVLTGYGFNLSWLTFFIVSVSTRLRVRDRGRLSRGLYAYGPA
jgi:hypothetical protein